MQNFAFFFLFMKHKMNLEKAFWKMLDCYELVRELFSKVASVKEISAPTIAKKIRTVLTSYNSPQENGTFVAKNSPSK